MFWGVNDLARRADAIMNKHVRYSDHCNGLTSIYGISEIPKHALQFKLMTQLLIFVMQNLRSKYGMFEVENKYIMGVPFLSLIYPSRAEAIL